MNKRYWLLSFAVIAVILVTAAAFITTKKAAQTLHHSAENGFAVVELFTSEGCSSCPSAEEVVARLSAKNTANVYILTYHVDYWDRLGWKDPFSQAAFSQRQNQYAAVFNQQSVYTPQIVFNGAFQFVGSEEGTLAAAVEKGLTDNPPGHFTIDPKKDNNSLRINYHIDGNEAVLLNVALIQPEATTSVKRGENGGKTLHHVNVVRALTTSNAKGVGVVKMDIPADLTGIPLKVIAFTQAKKDLQVLAAVQKQL